MVKKVISDIQWLFFKREGKELLGRRGGNFIILMLVLVFSLLSIAFARSSRIYLKERMEDPFVTWMDIVTEQGDSHRSMNLVDFLENKEIQDSCSFSNPLPTFTTNRYFYAKNKNTDIQFQGRSFDVNASIWEKIISSSNVIVRKEGEFSNESFGVIVTVDVLKELGYSLDSIPDYLFVAQPTDICKSEELHCKQVNEYIPIAIPVLAVVKDVPGVEYSFMFSKELHNVWNDVMVWDVLEKKYNTSLCLFGDSCTLEAIESRLDVTLLQVNHSETKIDSWNNNVAYLCISQDSLSGEEETIFLNDLYNELKELYPSIDRVYHFNAENSYDDYIPIYSIELLNLKKVRVLQNTLKEKCGIRLDMRSIESQENFYYVEVMSNVLTWAIIAIVVVFIFVMIYFILYTHFQKIQKNIGTFKAFGFSNKKLYGIYLVLIVGNVLAAFFISMCGLAIIQLILHLFKVGMVYEGRLFPYFDVFIPYSLYLLLTVIAVASLSTIIVAYRKLHHTPGDLIYNRNQ